MEGLNEPHGSSRQSAKQTIFRRGELLAGRQGDAGRACQFLLRRTDRAFIAIQLPCSPGKYRESIDLAPFRDEIGTANPLMFLQTVGQIP